ncbi:hypothetical protein CBS147353_7239 [Aspergillus niger]|nr:hypothetical protein CBS147353_7239 [Aspergillus niger]
MDLSNPRCEHLASPDIKNFILSILIVFGILLSYTPQHVRILTMKTSFGISPYFVLLGTTSGSSALANESLEFFKSEPNAFASSSSYSSSSSSSPGTPPTSPNPAQPTAPP